MHFRLLQQEVIELIKAGKVSEAISFAQKEVLPIVEVESSLLEDLEQTMGLLAFDDCSKTPLAGLIDVTHRQLVASELNSAILQLQSHGKDTKLLILLKLLLWAQQQLQTTHNFPKLLVH